MKWPGAGGTSVPPGFPGGEPSPSPGYEPAVLEASYDDETIQDAIDVTFTVVELGPEPEPELEPDPEPRREHEPDPEVEPEPEPEAEVEVEVEVEPGIAVIEADDLEIDLTVLDDPSVVDGPTSKRPRIPRLTVVWPGDSERSVPPDFPGADKPDDLEPAIRGGRSEPGARAPRGVSAIVSAVYSALADPLAGADEAAREQRALRVRKAGVVTGSVFVTAVLIYTIFPVRTYLDQKAATNRAKDEIEILSEANEKLAERAEDLRTPEVVEQTAREDHGMVFPGEESYRVMPPQVATTVPTTTTTVPPLR